MKKMLLLLLLCNCASVHTRSATGVNVLTYNIHAGKDAAQTPNIARVAAFIDSVKADVVMLQEVDRKTTRANGEDHLAQLEQLTGLHAAFAKSLDYQGGEYGIALLSRWPIDSAVVVPLVVEPPQERAGGSREPRVALHAVVRSPFGPLHVINTHIDPAREGTFRKQEIVGLLARVHRNVPAGDALIFGGDLNARPTTDEISAVSSALTDSWTACGGGGGETFPSSGPDRRIDYVFFRRARCVQARVPRTQASDHRPLLVTLQF